MSPNPAARLVVAVLAAWVAPTPTRAHGSLHERIAQLAVRLERTPTDAHAHLELAELFCRHGDWLQALGYCDSAEGLKRIASIDLVRGEAYLGLHRPAAARDALDRFLAINPSNAPALVLRARASAAIAGPTAALANYRAALKCDSTLEADHVREAAKALACGGWNEEAIAALSRAIVTFGPDPGLLQQALDLEIAAGHTDDALARLAALEAAAPRREGWMARRARLLSSARREDAARIAWSELLRHIESLPNLERGLPDCRALAAEARAALAPAP